MTANPLYDEDFKAWTVQQAEALRSLARGTAGVPVGLDPEHLAEEVEDLGKRDQHALDSALARIIEHLLKLDHSPAAAPRRGWRDSVSSQRMAVEELIDQSPSLKPGLPAALSRSWPRGRRLAALGLEVDRIAPSELPDQPPYSLEQVLDADWWPANRYGLN